MKLWKRKISLAFFKVVYQLESDAENAYSVIYALRWTAGAQGNSAQVSL